MVSYIPNDPAVLRDPFPLYAQMREEDPAHWSPALKAWVLTRYDDVRRACLDTAGMSSDRLRPFFATLPASEMSPLPGRMNQTARGLPSCGSGCVGVRHDSRAPTCDVVNSSEGSRVSWPM